MGQTEPTRPLARRLRLQMRCHESWRRACGRQLKRRHCFLNPPWCDLLAGSVRRNQPSSCVRAVRLAIQPKLWAIRIVWRKARLFPVRRLIVMLPQQIFAKIVFKIAPDGVNVVRVVLGVVVFHQERRTLHPVEMTLLWLDASGPGEIEVVRSGMLVCL